MSTDYDLIVIGGTLEGIYAAIEAAYFKARVALVEQPFPGLLEVSEEIYNRAFSQATRFFKKNTAFDLTKVHFCASEVISILKEQNSLAILAALGVDIISGSGEFCRLPQEAFIVNNRRLRSRAYLIATGSYPIVPEIEGLEATSYLTTADIWQQDRLELLPNNLIIIGSCPSGIELAQNLRRIGKNITLVTENNRILLKEELEVSLLIQAILEAEGIKIYTQSPVIQVKKIGDKKWLQIGNRGIEVDEIILASQRNPNINALNLEGVGVQIGQQGIEVNQKLQTTNPRIYACGNVASVYNNTYLAQYEAHIAVKNALFLPLFKVNYSSVPWVLFTNPPLARVGITEAQARMLYGDKIFVTQQYFKTVAQAQILGETTGFCKLIIRGNGEILGAHIIGSEAGELITTIALAIKNKIKIQKITNEVYPSLTLSAIIKQSAIQWRHQQVKRNKRWQNCLENLFLWRRNWNL